MKLVIPALLRREKHETIAALMLVVVCLALAAGLVAMAVPGAHSGRQGPALIELRADPDAGGLERYQQRGGSAAGYEVVF
jgi:hypothetical protein